MKGKICGLLSALFITLGFSLSVSSNVNAAKHPVKYIPISSEASFSGNSVGYNTENPAFSIQWNSTYMPSISFFNLNRDHYFGSHFVSSSNKCEYGRVSPSIGDNYSSVPAIINGYEFYWRLPSYRYFYNESIYPQQYTVAQCMQTLPFGSVNSFGNISSHPSFDDSSLVNIPLTDRFPYLGLLPYYYDYDSFYVSDSAIDTSTGITYTNSLKMSEITGFSPVTDFKDLVIPLGSVNSEVTGSFTSGRSVKFDGVFDFSGEGNTFSWGNFDGNEHFELRYSGRSDSLPNNFYGSVPCTTNFISLDLNNFYQLEFSCSLIVPYDVSNDQLYFWLDLHATDYLFHTNADWSFGASYFITDNDETPGGVWGHSPTGNNLSSAPGSAASLIPGNEDFFSSITNMFGFNFINPFAPLFEMFSNNNSCANIPTIAGMIHAENSQICPWFDSTTRNIVTPVFGIASMMLVFGFAVRWLGARSGNMFEDSFEGSSGSISIGTKGRSK